MQIKELIESLRIEETKDHSIVYDLEPHIQRLYKSIQELQFTMPQSLQETKILKQSQLAEFILLMQTQIKAKTQYQFNKGVAFFDSRFNLSDSSISLRQRGSMSKIHKLRLIYKREGGFEIQIEEYKRDLDKDWSVKVLKPEEFQIDSKDKKWRHKFSPRPVFAESKADELIWSNEKNQICEASFSNIFFQDQNKKWHTPHLDSNILPGIMRAKLIKELNTQEGFYSKLPNEILLVNSMFIKEAKLHQ